MGEFCQRPTAYGTRTTMDVFWWRSPLRTTTSAFRDETTLQIAMSNLREDAPRSSSIANHALPTARTHAAPGWCAGRRGADPLGVHAVPPGPATFRLSRTVELRPGLLPLSTRVDTEWMLPAAPPRAGKPPVPVRLLDVAVHLPMDLTNRVPAGQPLELVVTAADATRVWVELSTDGGSSSATGTTVTGPPSRPICCPPAA